MAKEDFLHIPYGLTVHGQEEIDAVIHVLKTSTQMGKHVRELEVKIAASFEKKHGIMVNSGSSALLLAMEIMDLPKGSEVITPALTFATTVGYIIRNGLVPAFVDVEPDTYCIDPNKIEEMIAPKTRAIIAPHLIGNIVNWQELQPLIKRYNLQILEDSADTLGSTINGVSSGKLSDLSITSFYGSHVINCAGNGGMLCVNDDKLAKKAKLLRSWGRSSSLFIESEAIENRFNVNLDGIDYDAKFVFEEIGHNLEPSEMGAAFGLVQLNKLDHNINERTKNFNIHTKFFNKYQEFFVLPQQTENARTGWLAYPLIIKEDAPFNRREMQIFLEKRNIQTRVVFTGNILRQPGFANVEMRTSKDGYPQADNVMRGGILVACHHGLTQEMREHIHASCELFLGKFI
ncbi:DegT/DnrJ/EryC1/StrS family aminotransferase [Candidatus Enterovibrio escicola]|uniref:Pleiotropic regulatory protein n=1 Tax=Candidatus Enterovibrio escicola TaxID=1927127 RepID=A0A2A5T742_9GAMM|nr:DegT/DnrJ/EryC1/StrS family aminotransferase [Candidatus Enterovibrio escacola]PCS23995.1 Pleiotropic regulatory protein [Candidatus Enterovibrio escacola]